MALKPNAYVNVYTNLGPVRSSLNIHVYHKPIPKPKTKIVVTEVNVYNFDLLKKMRMEIGNV